MKYLNLKTVVSAYNGCYNKTKNQFWGLLAILKAINCRVYPFCSYKFNGADVSRHLDSLFCPNVGVGDYKTDYYYATFSKEWIDKVAILMLKEKPNILDVCCWYFHNRSFDDSITADDLIDLFLKEIQLTKDETANWFSFDIKPIEFYSTHFFDSELLSELDKNGFVYPQDGSLSFDKKTGLTSKAGQLTAANFVQSLYSALSIEECLILSKFDFYSLYNSNITDNKIQSEPAENLQQIFYGAPGTGKSHTIQERTEHEDVIRTTFHPDTDYSTFVGAYKPTTIDAPVMTVIGTKAVPVENEDGSPRIEPKIIYEFVNQAFLQAYVKAWEKYSKGGFDNAQKQFLVIEEINRGNCAQIFGDLFQLLDRNDAGFSDYPIKADADMAKQLKKQLKGLTIEDPDTINSLYKGENIVSQVLNGELLLLPKNLYIWATMNTSDQSLFPIDSAFKRRWDWQYMPIANGFENWYISVDDYKFDWWLFLQKINKLIGATTHSEDKKLGYYFCKAKNKEIDANLFVSKVIFYLWNDVFKDYEFANSVFDDIDGKKLTFDMFYTTINGNTIVVEDKVVMFLNKLDEAIDKEYSMLLPNVETTTGLSGNDFTNYSFEGSAPMGKSELGKTIMLKYLNENAGLTFDEIKAVFPDSLLGSVASKGLIVKDEEDLGSYQRYYVGGFKSADGVKFKIYKQWTVGNIQNIKNFAFSQGWNVEEKGSWRRKDNNA